MLRAWWRKLTTKQAPPAPVPAEMRDRLRTAVGRPRAEIVQCWAFQTLPGVFRLVLRVPGPDAVRTLVTRGDDVWLEHGPAVAARFLDAWHVDNRTPIDFSELVMTLHALGGLPAGLDENVTGGTNPPTVATRPLRLCIVKPVVSQGPSGGYAPARFTTYALFRDDGEWVWERSQAGGMPGVPHAVERWPLVPRD